MNKLKELAYKQITNGSKEIDYQEIVRFIQQEHGFFNERPSKGKPAYLNKAEAPGELNGMLAEPAHPEMTDLTEENQRRW